MRKRESTFHSPAFGYWLVGTVVAVVAITAYLLTQQAALPRNAPTGQVVDVVSPLPTTVPTVQPVEPTPPAVAACIFKADASAAPQPQDELRISLSTPQAVLTDTHYLRIGDWSPDGSRILLARWEREGQSESIDAFNVASHELQPFGIRRRRDGLPFWDQTGKVALFEESYRDKNGTVVPLQLVRAEAGSPAHGITPQRTILARDLAAGPQAANINPSDGSITVFLNQSPLQPVAVSPVSGQVEAAVSSLPALTGEELSGDPGKPGYSKPYQVAWNPKGGVVAFYNAGGFLLYDTATNHLCGIDIGQIPEQEQIWALEARWSPSGRYLAILKVPGEPPFLQTWLEILDTFDGSLHDIASPTTITTMRWLPSSDRGLLVARRVPNDQGIGIDTLLLADPGSGQSQPVTDGMIFGGLDYYGFEFSPDGKMLALPCPIRDLAATLDLSNSPTQDTLCLTEIRGLQ